MKPLTANDLLEQRNQETNQFEEWFDVFEIISNCRKLGLSELERHSILSNRFELKQKHTNAYHEPNQTTMNTEAKWNPETQSGTYPDKVHHGEMKVKPTNTMDYTEQPFNLETALKHPEWVYFRNGEKPLEWHWFEKALLTIAIADKVYSYRHASGLVYPAAKSEQGQDLILRVPYREVFINLFPNGLSYWYNSKDAADNDCGLERIACVPVKIPAI